MSIFHGVKMFRLPPLGALRSFEAAARQNSFSRAAEELHVTQSAISHQIRQLEEWFGVELFDRQGRQTIPTPQGAELAQVLAGAFSMMNAACERVAKNDSTLSITVAAIPSVATIWLIPRLSKFHKLHPEINVRLLHAIFRQKIDFNDVDLGIAYGDWKDAPANSTKFLDGISYPVCSAFYSEQMGSIQNPEDLLRCDLLHDIDRKAWQRWFKAADLKVAGQQQGPLFEGFNMLHASILSGQGIGLAPTAILVDDLNSGRLIKLFNIGVLQEKAYYISEPENPRSSKVEQVDIFKRWLIGEAQSTS
jgi:LysR family transcriptional regulator, glycine cleavage system transcriptional activator